MNIIKAITGSVAAVLLLSATVGCCKEKPEEPVNVNRKVLLFYECGFNNLTSYLKDNMDGTEKGLPAGYVPRESGDVVLIYSRYSKVGDYNYTPVESHLRRIYKKPNGKIVSDTLKTFGTETIAASSSTMRQVLTYVKDEFPAKGYGLVFSSHGSGWLPAGYFSEPSRFENDHQGEVQTQGTASLRSKGNAAILRRLPVPVGNLADTDPYYGMTRSIGQDAITKSYYGHEMSVSEFVDAIPYHLDYILFDMCYTAGVEMAYALKDKADYLGLSPAEVLGDGMFNYTKITSFLLNRETPDLEGLFKDSFEMYDKQSGDYRSSTVNLVRTSGLDNLASVCARMINEYSDALADAPVDDIQGYYRRGRHYFYDLVDIFEKCGASKADLEDLHKAVDGCVIYKNSTGQFLEDYDIKAYSGFSMYLPCAGTPLLDLYYRKEVWNNATRLVK